MAYTTINKPSLYFDTKLYTGTGSAQSITGLEFSPDFVWIKDRTSANNNRLLDIVRGATKELYSSTTDSETTQAQSLTAFNADGFSIGTLSTINTSSNNYVSWNWEANGAGSANTAGTISSTVSANTTAGFSIVKYTGTGANATVGHGLGVAPKMIIIKGRDTTYDWVVWFSGFSTTQRILLNSSDAISTGAWNTLPTSSVFGLGTQLNINQSGSALIAYCFADVKGYSKFGSYTGNGSTDGTFVYTGFKPAFVMVKNTSSSSTNWTIVDNKRNTFNPETQWLYANASDAEINPSAPSDFLSNGFKLRTTGSYANTGSQTYIYMAFAEQPLVGTNNVPATAR